MPINMVKGQRISLEKEAGRPLTVVTLGLGWDPAAGTKRIDLDASCVVYDAAHQMLDAVWFQSLSSRDGAIRHTGDNLTGAGDGDDEQIIVDLSRVHPAVDTLVFTITSFSGQTFEQVQNAFCRVVDQATGREIARYNLSTQGHHDSCIMAKLYRRGGDWKMAAIGEMTSGGATYRDLLPAISGLL